MFVRAGIDQSTGLVSEPRGPPAPAVSYESTTGSRASRNIREHRIRGVSRRTREHRLICASRSSIEHRLERASRKSREHRYGRASRNGMRAPMIYILLIWIVLVAIALTPRDPLYTEEDDL